MAAVIGKSFDAPDEVRTPDKARLEVIDLGGAKAMRMTAQPGWRWSESIKPVVGGESCQARHVGMVQSGRLHFSFTMTAPRARDLEPGARVRDRARSRRLGDRCGAVRRLRVRQPGSRDVRPDRADTRAGQTAPLGRSDRADATHTAPSGAREETRCSASAEGSRSARDDVRLCYTDRMAGETLPLELDDEIREAIASAFDSGNIVTVAYNGDDGWPHVSRSWIDAGVGTAAVGDLGA